MHLVSDESIAEHELLDLDRIIQEMERSLARRDAIYRRVRRHRRWACRSRVSVSSRPITKNSMPRLDELPIGRAYSLSRGGIGFLCGTRFDCEHLSVALHLLDGEVKWMAGRVVRNLAIPGERYIDYGLEFLSSGAKVEEVDDPASRWRSLPT